MQGNPNTEMPFRPVLHEIQKTILLEKLFDIAYKNRRILSKYLENMPKEQLLNIPKGHRNNIWWNIVHVVVTQQLLVYKLCGQPLRIAEGLVLKYKKGTVPDGMVTDEEIEEIKELLVSTIEWTLQDYQKGLFKRYAVYSTSIDITLRNVEDAMAFNVYHEGLHLGVIRSLEKAL